VVRLQLVLQCYTSPLSSLEQPPRVIVDNVSKFKGQTECEIVRPICKTKHVGPYPSSVYVFYFKLLTGLIESLPELIYLNVMAFHFLISVSH